MPVPACGKPSSESVSIAGTASTTTEKASIDVVLDLSLASFEIAVDRAKGILWLATVQPVDKDTLWAVDTNTGAVRGFNLPDVGYNGYTTHIRVGQDGVVWASLPYQLVRVEVQYDTAAGALVRRAADGSKKELQLERVTGQRSGGGIDPETGKQRLADTTVTLPDRITDFAVGDDGSVWFLRHNGTQLARWNP